MIKAKLLVSIYKGVCNQRFIGQRVITVNFEDNEHFEENVVCTNYLYQFLPEKLKNGVLCTIRTLQVLGIKDGDKTFQFIPAG